MRKNIWDLFGSVLVCAISFVGSSAASANTVTFCRHDNQHVDTVFWHAQSSVPDGLIGAHWSEVESDLGSSFERLIAQNSSLKVLKATDSAEKTISAHPNSVYLNVVFSYAPKDAFSTPLEQDALVIWIETTRDEPRGDASLLPITKRSRADLFLLGTAPFNGAHFLKFASPFSYGTIKLVTYVSCQVLHDDTDKTCTDGSDPMKNTVIEKPKTVEKCVEPPRDP